MVCNNLNIPKIPWYYSILHINIYENIKLYENMTTF